MFYIIFQIDDFNSLYESTSTAQSIVVVGGGFLGSELAVSLQNRGTSNGSLSFCVAWKGIALYVITRPLKKLTDFNGRGSLYTNF